MPDSTAVTSRPRRWLPRILALAMLLLAAGLALLLVFSPVLPATVAAGPGTASTSISLPTTNTTLHLLIALLAVITLGRGLALLLAWFGQPPVIGEVLAGILLGPSLLGSQLSALVIPPSILPALGAVAQLGVILYMFMVGLETNAGLLAQRPYSTLMISNFSIVVPFLLGAILAPGIYGLPGMNLVPYPAFALFLGIAMSITAFPVLARILTDLRISTTELGITALAAAAINDVTAWCLLALIIGYIRTDVGSGVQIIGETVLYVFVLFALGRPLLKRLLGSDGRAVATSASPAWIFAALLLSTIATEAIGIHAIFGAFMLGVIVPHDSPVSRTLPRQLEPLVTIVLLPAFFALTGARTRIDLIAGLDQWGICLLILLVAMFGKIGGTLLAARLSGLGWRMSVGLGALMNTRGLMELIVLNLGLDLHIISPTLFSMMVLMTLVTTMMSGPLLKLLKLDRAGEAAAR